MNTVRSGGQLDQVLLVKRLNVKLNQTYTIKEVMFQLRDRKTCQNVFGDGVKTKIKSLVLRVGRESLMSCLVVKIVIK